MKLKYYLRGLGIGIIVTTLILMIAGAGQKKEMTDAQVIERAKELGMVMEESSKSTVSDEIDSESEKEEETNQEEPTENTNAADGTQDGQTEQTVTPEEEQSPTPDENTPSDAATAGQSEPAEQEPYRLAVNAGEVCRQVCDELQENGLIDNSENFRKYLSQAGYANQIQPGNFEIAYGLSYEEIAQILITRQQ